MWTRAARLAASCTFMQILHLATRFMSVHLHVLNRVVSNLISTQAHSGHTFYGMSQFRGCFLKPADLQQVQ